MRLELQLADDPDLDPEVPQSPEQVVLNRDRFSTATACDGSAASAASGCVTSSGAPGDKVPPASSASPAKCSMLRFSF